LGVGLPKSDWAEEVHRSACGGMTRFRIAASQAERLISTTGTWGRPSGQETASSSRTPRRPLIRLAGPDLAAGKARSGGSAMEAILEATGSTHAGTW